MRVYRLIRAPWVSQALTGEGARRYGSRWNPKGVPMVYTASTLSLAALETLVHFAIDTAPLDYVALTIRVPDDAVESVADSTAPRRTGTRRRRLPRVRSLERAGRPRPRASVSRFLRWWCLLRTNILLNPLHPDFAKVTLEKQEPFLFDSRLFPAG